MIRKIFAHHDQPRLALCVYRMFTLRSMILQGTLQAGHAHPDLPRPNQPLRPWWQMGSDEDLSLDDY